MTVRRLAVLGLAALFLCSAGTAFALTAAHQKVNTLFDGDCQACHIPHKAAGAQRGFPIEPAAATQATYGYIGAFCLQRCHDGSVANADLSLSVMSNATAVPPVEFAGGANGSVIGSHGVGKTTTNAPASTVVAATLPYGNDGTGVDSLGNPGFECTTCHDVHKNASGDTSNALLQLDIDALCDECHTNRGAGDGTWAGYGAANATGSHPVGVNVTGDSDGDDSPITFASSFQAAYGAAGDHNLGGHGIDGQNPATSGMSCVTCHAVHGTQADVNPPSVQAVYTEDLLAVAVIGTTGTADPDLHANGAGEVNNALCEGCHGAAASKWNPGNTTGSHPTDDMDYGTGSPGTLPTVKDMGVIPIPTGDFAFGTDTTAGVAGPSIGMGATTGNQGPRVICESCHTPHPNANDYTYDGTNAIAKTGTAILRAPNTSPGSVCNLCHNVTPTAHHPVNVAMGGTTGYGDSDIDAGTANLLECSDCHGGTNGAHNWVAVGSPGLNALWEPLDNGRAAEAAIVSGMNVVASTSKECADCHLNGTNPSNWNRFSPSRATPGNGNADYQDHGDGSHFLGLTAWLAADWQRGNVDGTSFDASLTNSSWNGKTGAHSRFAGATTSTPELVCESCHDLEPDKNADPTGWDNYGTKNNLLLYNFAEGESVAGTGSVYRSYLCEGCHGHTPGGGTAVSTHPLTGGTVTKAEDMGRTPTTLITGAGSYANQTSPAAPGDGTYPVADAMNCDSCHQVHDANTQSGTYILDTADANVSATTPRAVPVTLYTDTGYTRSSTTVGGMDYGSFCIMCHAY